jgi:hypothetical protein
MRDENTLATWLVTDPNRAVRELSCAVTAQVFQNIERQELERRWMEKHPDLAAPEYIQAVNTRARFLLAENPARWAQDLEGLLDFAAGMVRQSFGDQHAPESREEPMYRETQALWQAAEQEAEREERDAALTESLCEVIVENKMEHLRQQGVRNPEAHEETIRTATENALRAEETPTAQENALDEYLAARRAENEQQKLPGPIVVGRGR